MKKLGKARVIWCHAAGWPIHYGFCPSEKAWNRVLKEYKAPSEPYPTKDATIQTFTSSRSRTFCLLTVAERIDDYNDPNGTVGLIVHEATHIWQQVLISMGETDKPGCEIEAYAIQQITQQLLLAYEASRLRLFRRKKKK